MAVLLALYPEPENKEKFDDYYWNTHIPLVKKMPNLKSVEISKEKVEGPYYLVARLTWDSMEAMNDSLQSKEGQEASEDTKNFAPPGTEILLYDTVSVI